MLFNKQTAECVIQVISKIATKTTPLFRFAAEPPHSESRNTAYQQDCYVSLYAAYDFMN
jgi:hypothetical protein